jgi:hypothetical protein
MTCEKCGYDGEHSSEKCVRIRIADEVLAESEIWYRNTPTDQMTMNWKRERLAEATRELERAMSLE